MVKQILYYTDNWLKEPLFSLVQAKLLEANLPIISVSLKPINFGKNIHYKGKRSYLTMFKQILTGLKASSADFIFMCEHDVLYHPSHFKFTPPRKDMYYYNNNVWKYKPKTGQCVAYDGGWLSQLCASRKILINHYTKKVEIIENNNNLRRWRFEPGTKKGIDHYKIKLWESEYPNVDIRHGRNLTGVRRFDPKEFRGDPKRVCPNFKRTTVDKILGWDTDLLLSL
jgi:hypothetical protein